MNVFEALEPPQISLQPVDTMAAYRNRQGAEYVRKAAAIVKTAFEVTGDTQADVYKVYSMLLRDPTPTAGKLKLASIAMTCLGKVVRRQQEAVKLASAFPAAVRALWSGGRAVLPEVLHMLAFMGGTAGAAAGGGMWALNRSIKAEDQKNRELEIQRDTYRQLTAEVQDELKRRNLAPTPENQAAAVDYLT